MLPYVSAVVYPNVTFLFNPNACSEKINKSAKYIDEINKWIAVALLCVCLLLTDLLHRNESTPSAHAHSSLHSSLGISRLRSRVLCEEKPAGGSGLASPVVTCSVTSARCGCTVTAHTGALVSRIELGFVCLFGFLYVDNSSDGLSTVYC